MKKLVAIVALGALLVGLVAPPAHAHGGAVLALAAFTAFNLLFLPFALAATVLAPPPPVVFARPAVIVSPAAPPVAFARPAIISSTVVAPASNARVWTAPAAPAISREVVYAHGRYVLYGDGVSQPFQWIWVPNPPPPGSAPGH